MFILVELFSQDRISCSQRFPLFFLLKENYIAMSCQFWVRNRKKENPGPRVKIGRFYKISPAETLSCLLKDLKADRNITKHLRFFLCAMLPLQHQKQQIINWIDDGILANRRQRQKQQIINWIDDGILANRRQRGRVIRALDLKSGGPGFKSHSDR